MVDYKNQLSTRKDNNRENEGQKGVRHTENNKMVDTLP